MSKRTCLYCRFSTQIGNREGGGLQCRRSPPGFISIHNFNSRSHGFFWPTVDADDSCGEWKDDSTSPETEARNQLRQQLVVAMVAGRADLSFRELWEEASRIADCDPEVNDD